MKQLLVAGIACAIAVIAASSIRPVGTGGLPAAASAAALPACQFPAAEASTPEETAWRIFVAANCPATPTSVVWETWVEQQQLYSGASSLTTALHTRLRRLHSSPLANAKRLHASHLKVTPFAANTGCHTMQGPPPGPPKLQALTICEEVHINADAAQFILKAGYEKNAAQAAAAQKGADIEFPAPSVEVKVDWIPATDFANPFSCSSPPAGIHVELINGTCYAMAGMHIESKLLKNWLWATFEPQYLTTNPRRCITFGNCNDPWGSLPATSSGGPNGTTKQTPALAALMKQAHLAPEFANYRLDGAQIDFTKTDGSPTILGNSVIEGENVGLTTSSCITCHSYSAIKTDGSDNINNILPPNPTGGAFQPPAGWIARDFVWSLSLAQ